MLFLRELRHAARTLLRAPAFALTAIGTVAIGSAGTTTVFAALDALLLRPLPVSAPGDLVALELRREDGSGTSIFSYPQYTALRERATGLAGLTAYSLEQYAITYPDLATTTASAWEVSEGYFGVLGIQPALGRFFSAAPAAGETAEEPVVVISHALWQGRFGGTPDVLGRTLRANGQPLTIIGVAPEGFHGTISVVAGQLWVPLALVPTLRDAAVMHRPGGMYWLTLAGRLAPGTERHQAAALLSGQVRALMAADGEAFDPRAGFRTNRSPASGIALAPLRGLPHVVVGPATGFLALLLVAALLVLFIASVNITSIMLARITMRARELAVRRSLGASRLRIMAQLLTENSLLFAAGTAAGLLLTAWALAALPLLLAPLSGQQLALDVAVDARVLAFAGAVALLLSVLFGVPPALHGAAARETSLTVALNLQRRNTRFRSTLVVVQMAACVVLLVSAGLLGRALQHALATDPGFDAAGVLSADLDLGTLGYDAERSRAFFRELRDRLELRPEISLAGLSTTKPLLGHSTMALRPEGHESAPAGGIDVNRVDPGFFHTLRVPIRIGRPFTDADVPGAPAVAVVNEAFVNEYWPDGNALGRQIHMGSGEFATLLEVVGVAATGRYRELTESPRPFVYLPLAQGRATEVHVYARGTGDRSGAALARVVAEEVRALDPAVPLRGAEPFQRTLGILLLPQRIGATAIGSFGLIGLLLAGVGLYGLVAFTVAQREREFGIRIALGARTSQILTLVLGHSLVLLAIGGGIGIVLALGAAQLLTALLHGVHPADPLTFLTVPLLLAAAALLPAYLPARRAGRTDPADVLRSD